MNPADNAATHEVRTTCPYCGVGCGVIATTDGVSVQAVRGDPEHPANFGRLCSKGSTLHQTSRGGGRLLQPLARLSRDAPREAVEWEQAMALATGRFADIVREHGPDAVAFYGSGQLLTEDYYVLNKLARVAVGTNNLDTNSRLCMSSAVAGYKATLGADSVPACYEDIDHADLLFVAGSNTAYAHPIVMRRIEAARSARPGQRMIVVDPRRTDTAQAADLHLAILPGTDVALFHAMLHWLIWEEKIATDWIAAHTEGFEALRQAVRETSPRAMAGVCGVREADIVTAARWWAESGSVLSLYCQGLNQSSSGTDKNAALIGLHLATAQIGRPGAGPLSLTGQPNAMGGREVGALANLLPGHRDLSRAADRDEVARYWNVASVPATPGLSAVELFEGLHSGRVRAVWIVCTNPAQSMPDSLKVRQALERAEFVVVQEAFADTETLRHADVALPATTWGEKDGTVTNSERRISRVRAVLPAPGEARADWSILADAARRLARALHPGREQGFTFDSAEAVWLEHRGLTVGRDLDIGGLTWERLERDGPQQWPLPAGAQAGQVRLYDDARFATADGKARFSAAPWRPVAEPVDARYPIALTTGRLRDQWHSMSRTGRVPALFAQAEAPTLDMHVSDLTRRGLIDGEPVMVSSRRGRFVALAHASDEVRSGQAFLPMHWGDAFVRGEGLAGINALTLSHFDPVSKQPELKHSAIRVSRIEARWELLAMTRLPRESLETVRERWLAACAHFEAVWVVPMGGDHAGLCLRGFAREPASAMWLADFDRLIGADGSDVMAYDDAAGGHGRRVRVEGDAVWTVRLSGRMSSVPGASAAPVPVPAPASLQVSANWLRGLLTDAAPVRPLSRWLLSPVPPPQSAFEPRDPLVCVCHGVGARAIDAALTRASGSGSQRLAALQSGLRCGTSCGSCVPQLRARAQAIADNPGLASLPAAAVAP
ncbi:MAG: molybdopterin-dependent oxidoreductase [Burkholderiaceae bacterium]|nr:molybdopterin-dependent oxidoreductase [Burkholderiaceae bacterium]